MKKRIINENFKQDICGRLPYGLKCLVEIDDTEFDEFTGKIIGFKGKSIGELYLVDSNDLHVELYFNEDTPEANILSDMSNEGIILLYDIKPYLRPMSSMTENEEREARILWNEDFVGANNWYHCYPRTMDFYNKNHFDYRDLIKKGLALEAPKGMYK